MYSYPLNRIKDLRIKPEKLLRRILASSQEGLKNWCVPFGTQRVETEGVIRMNEGIEMNPKADDSHPNTNRA